MQLNTGLAKIPAGESNDRPLLGSLAVLVVLLHSLVLMRLLDINNNDKANKPPKVVEVVLLKPEPIKPKEKIIPPPPKPPTPPKAAPPKKPAPKPRAVEKPKPIEKPKPVKPVVKKDVPPKAIKNTTEVKPVLKNEYRPPVLTSPFAHSTKSVAAPAAKPSFTPSARPAAKPGRSVSAGGKGGNSDAVAVFQVKPSYPMRAKSRGIQGWVKIQFTVTASGAVTGPAVVGGSPPGIFDQAGLAAVRQYRFKPKMVNGVATAQSFVRTFKFELPK